MFPWERRLPLLLGKHLGVGLLAGVVSMGFSQKPPQASPCVRAARPVREGRGFVGTAGAALTVTMSRGCIGKGLEERQPAGRSAGYW